MVESAPIMAPVAALLGIGLIFGGLPPEGYVSLDRLVQADSAWQRVTRLQRQAEALRARAADLPSAVVPAAPQPPAQDTGERLDLRAEGYEVKAAQLELELLRAAQRDQIDHNRQRRTESRSADLFGGWRAYRLQQLESRHDWERNQALFQRLPQTNAMVRLRQPNVSVEEAAELELERRVTGVLNRMALAERRRETEHAATRYLRQRFAVLQEDLDHQARDELRAADRSLARREAELADESAQREQYRRERLATMVDLKVDLELGDWQQTLAQRGGAGAARRTSDADQFRAAAAALDQQAEAAAAALREVLPQRLRAWLQVLAAQEHVTLHLSAAEGLADVTEQVATMIAGYAEDPATLAAPAAEH